MTKEEITKERAQHVLALPLKDNDSGETTVRGYLGALLLAVWKEREGFSGKRPFGNSAWEYDLYIPLVEAGLITGTFDEDGYVIECDCKTGDRLIDDAIREMSAA